MSNEVVEFSSDFFVTQLINSVPTKIERNKFIPINLWHFLYLIKFVVAENFSQTFVFSI